MAKFSKMQVMAAMKETGMVPVFFNKDVEICKNVIKACYEGGVRVFEFTNRGDFAHEIFGELVKWADKACPEMILGAGTGSNIMVTGAVEPTEENLTPWIKAGVLCVGMGSKLFPKETVAAGDWAAITAKCQEALGYIAKARA